MTEVAASQELHEVIADLDEAIGRSRHRTARLRPLLLLADAGAALTIGGVGAMLGWLAPVGAAALLIGWPVALTLAGAYSPRTVGEVLSERTGQVLRAAGILGLLSWCFAAVGVSSVGTAAMVVGVALMTVVSITLRILSLKLPGHAPRIVLVGHEASVAGISAELARVPGSGQLAGAHLVGGRVDVPEILRLVRECDAETVLAVPGPDLTAATLRRLEWALARQGVDLCVTTGMTDVASSRLTHVSVAGLGMVLVRPASASIFAVAAKRIVDRVAAALLLLLAAPTLLAVALAVRIDSSGSSLFRQQRVGQDGREFTMLKFRTMANDAESRKVELVNELDGVIFKQRKDPRITRIGAILRRYSIDELPQLLNVVRGEMSLVGPRPALPSEVALYDEDPRERLRVKPGLTGLWQVSGRSDLSWEESVRLDLLYVDNWSPRLDAVILWRTVGAVFGHKGAY